MDKKTLQSFMSKVNVTRGCWFWMAAINNRGYGIFDGQCAHRVSFEHFRYPLDNELEVDHLCRVKHCVNPNHMEAVTHLENMRRSRHCSDTHCKYGHSLKDAYKNKRRGGRGYSRKCKVCHTLRMKKYYAEHRAHLIEKMKEYAQRRKDPSS